MIARTGLVAALLAAPGASLADARSDAHAVLARFSNEPTVAQVQRAAIRASRLGASTSDSWEDRVGVAPALPDLRLKAAHALDRDESLVLEPGAPDRLDLDAGAGWVLEASAEWELSRLVWDSDEVGIGREAVARAERRNDLTALVARLYFERRRRQVARALRAPASLLEMVEAEIGIAEITATLDGLTGGWYQRALRDTRRGPR